jgi:hypothetical protein
MCGLAGHIGGDGESEVLATTQVSTPFGKQLPEHRVRLIQLGWNVTSMQAVGTDRQPVADLLAKHNYSFYCAAPDGSLALLTNLHFDPDVFALPSL